MAKYLGIDFGKRRIGIAVSDPTGTISRSLKCIDTEKEPDVMKAIMALIEEHRIDEVVVGLPKNMNGTVGEQGNQAICFAGKIKESISKPVTLWDERLSTMEAQRLLISADVSREKRKKVIDGMAAQLILQNFLDCRKNV